MTREIRSLIDRVRDKVDATGGPDACHPWMGNVGQWGSPTISVKRPGGRDGGASARRVMWESVNGPCPDKRAVYTTCGRKDCMNPKHLTLQPVDDPVARFWRNVKRESGDGCWNWIAARSVRFSKGVRRGSGYGNFMVSDHKRVAAHRYSWELHFGPIPPGLFVCHKCDNPTCIRPDHLFLGTAKENHEDMVRKGRHSHGPEHGARSRAGQVRPKEQREKGVLHNRKLTPEVVASIVEAAKRGVGRQENARIHGLGRNTVYRALVAAGYHTPAGKDPR